MKLPNSNKRATTYGMAQEVKRDVRISVELDGEMLEMLERVNKQKKARAEPEWKISDVMRHLLELGVQHSPFTRANRHPDKG